jgi:hypothetical protein
MRVHHGISGATPDASGSSDRQVLRLEAIQDSPRHLVVDRRFLVRVGNRDDERKGLRLESLAIIDAMPCLSSADEVATRHHTPRLRGESHSTRRGPSRSQPSPRIASTRGPATPDCKRGRGGGRYRTPHRAGVSHSTWQGPRRSRPSPRIASDRGPATPVCQRGRGGDRYRTPRPRGVGHSDKPAGAGEKLRGGRIPNSFDDVGIRDAYGVGTVGCGAKRSASRG